MIALVAAVLFSAAAAPATAPAAKPEPAPAAKAEPTAKADPKAADPKVDAKLADDGHGHAPGKEEPPLDEATKQSMKVGEALAAVSRTNMAGYDDMLKTMKDNKDCPAASKAVSERMKTLDAEVAKKRALADGLRKGISAAGFQAAAGHAFVGLATDFKKYRERAEADQAIILAFRGHCPKEGPETDKLVSAVRKRIMPPENSAKDPKSPRP